MLTLTEDILDDFRADKRQTFENELSDYIYEKFNKWNSFQGITEEYCQQIAIQTIESSANCRCYTERDVYVYLWARVFWGIDFENNPLHDNIVDYSRLTKNDKSISHTELLAEAEIKWADKIITKEDHAGLIANLKYLLHKESKNLSVDYDYILECIPIWNETRFSVANKQQKTDFISICSSVMNKHQIHDIKLKVIYFLFAFSYGYLFIEDIFYKRLTKIFKAKNYKEEFIAYIADWQKLENKI